MALMFRARVGDKSVQGIDYLRLDGDGLIEEFTVMLARCRPSWPWRAHGPQVEGLAKAGPPAA